MLLFFSIPTFTSIRVSRVCRCIAHPALTLLQSIPVIVLLLFCADSQDAVAHIDEDEDTDGETWSAYLRVHYFLACGEM
ncbi:MAG: hypothetical protein JNL32_03415 [Candidatus Kapabacteria bacterium]|nr:hypothetical protein [Candidatus Kapabacteria bacterium]